jgi:hypothetical protein
LAAQCSGLLRRRTVRTHPFLLTAAKLAGLIVTAALIGARRGASRLSACSYVRRRVEFVDERSRLTGLAGRRTHRCL